MNATEKSRNTVSTELTTNPRKGWMDRLMER